MIAVAPNTEEETADFVSEAGAGFPILPDSGVGGLSWLAILSNSLPLGLAARADLRGSSVGVDIDENVRGGNEERRTRNERSNY